jgi:hypothetical protein
MITDQDLIKKYLAGDVDQETIVKRFYVLVRKISGSFGRKQNYIKRKDILSVAHEYYLKAIINIKKKKNVEPEYFIAYVKNYITNGIKKFIITDHLIKIDQRLITEDFEFPTFISSVEECGEWPCFDFEFFDLMDYIKLTEIEKEIVMFLFQGYKMKEIAIEIKKDRRTVTTLLNNIKRKAMKYEIR